MNSLKDELREVLKGRGWVKRGWGMKKTFSGKGVTFSNYATVLLTDYRRVEYSTVGFIVMSLSVNIEGTNLSLLNEAKLEGDRVAEIVRSLGEEVLWRT